MAARCSRLSQQDMASFRSRRVQVGLVGANDTRQSLASRMAYDDDKMARFLTLNQLGANARLKASDRVKLVTLR